MAPSAAPHWHARTGKLGAAALLLLSVCLGACSDDTPTPPPAVARVAEHAITPQQLQREVTQRRAATSAEVRGVLDDLVRRQVLLARARAAGYESDPQVVAVLERALIGKLRREHLEPRLARVTVTDAEVSAHYNAHSSEFATPARVRAAVIRISVPARASEEKRAELRQRAARAREEALALPQNTATFGSVAVKHSDHQTSRYRGGDTGWFQPTRDNSRWPAEVLEAVAAADSAGDVSPVIHGTDGYYLVKLIGRQASAPRPLEEVAEQIRHQLLRDKKAGIETAFHREMAREVTVEIDSGRLQQIQPYAPRSKGEQRPPSLPE